MVWFVRLHFAKFAGIWSKILWVTIGWLPALLYVSGIYMWRQKLNARKSKSNQPEM
ncbi:MAG: PepSY domain-containing protein [Candidatus Obscuribacter sp.]|nr:PepSY domain-containing protein [Candidatus Obscuribacter sp.]